MNKVEINKLFRFHSLFLARLAHNFSNKANLARDSLGIINRVGLP